MPSRSELRGDQAVLLVGTAGEWAISDVQEFLSTFDQAYGTLLAIQLAAQRIRTGRDSARWGPATLTDYVSRNLPPELPPHAEPWQVQPDQPQIGISSSDLPFGPEIRYLRFLFHTRYDIAPEAEPRILAWHMASPGSIQLVGLGDIILQLRELIKDLRYRNRQEKELGDLEITRKRLELQQSVLSPPVADYITSEVLRDARALRALETRRRLIIGDTLESVLTEIKGHLEQYASEVPEVTDILALVDRFASEELKAARTTLTEIADRLRELSLDAKLPEEQYHHLLRRLDDLHFAKVRAA